MSTPPTTAQAWNDAAGVVVYIAYELGLLGIGLSSVALHDTGEARVTPLDYADGPAAADALGLDFERDFQLDDGRRFCTWVGEVSGLRVVLFGSLARQAEAHLAGAAS
ncbi:MAG: hypothetical protein FWD18_00385 [Micrococcales bacterium]|nr:hypothetical protein [Micrococcales bacterium]